MQPVENISKYSSSVKVYHSIPFDAGFFFIVCPVVSFCPGMDDFVVLFFFFFLRFVTIVIGLVLARTSSPIAYHQPVWRKWSFLFFPMGFYFHALRRDECFGMYVSCPVKRYLDKGQPPPPPSIRDWVLSCLQPHSSLSVLLVLRTLVVSFLFLPGRRHREARIVFSFLFQIKRTEMGEMTGNCITLGRGAHLEPRHLSQSHKDNKQIFRLGIGTFVLRGNRF